MGRLLLDGDRVVVPVELDDAEALRVVHAVAEDRRPPGLRARGRAAQVAREAVAVEDVVAQDQRARAARHEPPAVVEGARQAVGLGLHRVGEGDPELGAVAQQALEVGRVLRRRDDEDVADAGKHERGERVVDHGLVVDRQQLLARHARERVKSRAGAARQDDALHY